GFCAFLLAITAGLAQTTTVTGKVTDDKGAPLAGASIIEKGTKNGVSADANGAFTIKVKSGAALIVSVIGFETTQVSAKNSNLI
ncbi:carboxypeptidase-like regulatory domain-containing protein, partial [Acinetobacter baumannii]